MNNQGEKIKEMVRQKGLTDEEFAKMLDITRQGVQDIFKRETIKPKLLSKILQILGVEESVSKESLQPEGSIAPASSEKDLYERLLAEKERVIKMLQPVSSLMDKIGNLEKEVLDLKRSLGK
jgi:transcriptional regulator with XRE-family HTH domain